MDREPGRLQSMGVTKESDNNKNNYAILYEDPGPDHLQIPRDKRTHRFWRLNKHYL